MVKLSIILSGTELFFTTIKSVLLLLHHETNLLKVGVWSCFLIEAAVGITLTVILGRTTWGGPNTYNGLIHTGVTIIIFTEVVTALAEVFVLRRKVHKVPAPDPSELLRKMRKTSKYVALGACAIPLVAWRFVILTTTHGFDKYPTDNTKLALVTTVIVAVFCVFQVLLSVCASIECFAIIRDVVTLLLLFSSLIFSACSVFAGWFSKDYSRSVAAQVDSGTQMFNTIDIDSIVAVFFTALGTFLVVLSAWRIPNLKIESDPESCNLNVLETAAFGVGVPLFVLCQSSNRKAAKLIFVTMLPQSLVIVSPIALAYLSHLIFQKSHEESKPAIEYEDEHNSQRESVTHC